MVGEGRTGGEVRKGETHESGRGGGRGKRGGGVVAVG